MQPLRCLETISGETFGTKFQGRNATSCIKIEPATADTYITEAKYECITFVPKEVSKTWAVVIGSVYFQYLRS